MSSSRFTNDVWILGATGHVGRAVAARLVEKNVLPVLVGRDRERLSQLAARLEKGLRTIVAASPEEMATEISQQRPAVVINTIGPFFTETTALIVRTCLPCSHYIDLANDMISASALLALHEEAVAAGHTLVTGAGFGVLATESVVLKLCQDHPTPDRARTDMLPSIEIDEGVIGEALAASIIDGLPYGGRCYKHGRLVRNRIGDSLTSIVLPDGSRVATASAPLGELLAAQRASGAPNVLAASSEVPTGPTVRVLLPFAIALLRIRPLRIFAKRRLASLHIASRKRPREYSWGHASVQRNQSVMLSMALPFDTRRLLLLVLPYLCENHEKEENLFSHKLAEEEKQMKMKLELMQIPFTDIDRARAFYVEKMGFDVDVDIRPNDTVRIIQLTPPGSACSIGLWAGLPGMEMNPGSLKGLHLVVGDINEAREALLGRGVEVGEIDEHDQGVKYAAFSDPDGNTWTLQEMPWRSSEF